MSYLLPDSRLADGDLMEGRKPTGDVEIDWEHPLSKGLIYAIEPELLYNSGYDLLGAKLTPPTAPTAYLTVASGNRIMQTPYHNSAFGGWKIDRVLGLKGLTFFTRVRNIGSLTNKYKILSGNNTSYLSFSSDGSVKFAVTQNGWTNNLLGSTPPIAGFVIGELFTIACTINAGDSFFSIYVNGVKQTVTYSTTATPSSIELYSFEILENSTGWVSSGVGFEFVDIYNRALSPQEIKSLHNNPYQFLVPK